MAESVVLFVDPASKSMGLSLWRGGQYLYGQTVEAYEATLSERLRTMAAAISTFYADHYDEYPVAHVVSERVQNSVVQVCVGAVMSVSPDLLLANLELVSPSSWKAWARKNGCKDKDPKGIPALTAVGWDFQKFPVASEDLADSILIARYYYASHNISFV